MFRPPPGFKEWLPKWKRNHFRTSTGKDVSNAGIIRYFDALLQERALAGQRVHLEYVKGHAGDVVPVFVHEIEDMFFCL